ncbi:hypothetical protein DB30_02194 [Enhygromyxa salina]|uniref:Uncharacterized protein n=1 Tax=Enhygromyxa salina TaxID=215803 RepID=A0A0C1ZKE1_9BACT|nr:hypothetical protein [Enhygromyxa salina]KIG17979.1 hypothetical protein DB30_02194 [Enhygromyxa salina]
MSTPAGMLGGGLVLGLVLGAGGMFGYFTYMASAPSLDCDAGQLCGAGTVCVAGRCELEVAETEVVEEDEAPEPGKRKRRRGRRGGGGGGGGDGGSAEEGELAAGGGPPIDNDSNVPRFNATEDQSISMSDGSERLSDGVIDRELAKLDSSFQACVRDAAARMPDLNSGTVRYSFGVDKKGKVTGVNASAPARLTEAGMIPCVRKAVYGHRFPAFDGPTMKVSSSFSVD